MLLNIFECLQFWFSRSFANALYIKASGCFSYLSEEEIFFDSWPSYKRWIFPVSYAHNIIETNVVANVNKCTVPLSFPFGTKIFRVINILIIVILNESKSDDENYHSATILSQLLENHFLVGCIVLQSWPPAMIAVPIDIVQSVTHPIKRRGKYVQ